MKMFSNYNHITYFMSYRTQELSNSIETIFIYTYYFFRRKWREKNSAKSFSIPILNNCAVLWQKKIVKIKSMKIADTVAIFMYLTFDTWLLGQFLCVGNKIELYILSIRCKTYRIRKIGKAMKLDWIASMNIHGLK